MEYSISAPNKPKSFSAHLADNFFHFTFSKPQFNSISFHIQTVSGPFLAVTFQLPLQILHQQAVKLKSVNVINLSGKPPIYISPPGNNKRVKNRSYMRYNQPLFPSEKCIKIQLILQIYKTCCLSLKQPLFPAVMLNQWQVKLPISVI